MVTKQILKKWDKISYEKIKKNSKLEKQYSKDFDLENYENEKIYNPLVKYNQNVFMPEDEEINDYRGKILSAIWNEKTVRNFDNEYFNLSGIERSIFIALILGFNFKDIKDVTKLEIEEIKKHALLGINKFVLININKCKSCIYLGEHDNCRINKKKVNKKKSFCSDYEISKAKKFEMELENILSIFNSKQENSIKRQIFKLLKQNKLTKDNLLNIVKNKDIYDKICTLLW